MSEEEIMQGINTTIAFMKEELKAEHSCFTIKELWALNGLLDLYQKEKEKNKELEKENWIMRTVDKQYISKNKIRELIKNKAYIDTYNFKTIAVKDILELLERK